MQYLYVCHFSNGHIKVGRSIDPKARISAHADRVACMGVELVEHHIAECAGHSAPAELALIDRCAQSATKRNKSEWFEGLDFPSVCEWCAEFSSISAENQLQLKYASALKTFLTPMTTDERDEFAKKCETTRGHLQNVMYGLKSCATDLAVHIDRESNGAVRRWELRPDDWHKHWPELIGIKDAPTIPSPVTTA